MDYLSQGTATMYMAQSALEIVSQEATTPMYSSIAIQSGASSFEYSAGISPINSLTNTAYFGSGLEYSHSANSFSSALREAIGSKLYSNSNLNSSSYLSLGLSYIPNGISSYGANSLAIRSKNSSTDINSMVSNSQITHVEMNFNPIQFIRPKAGGIFVAKTGKIKLEIKETFEKLMGEEFPDDIKLSVLSASEFRKICSNPGVVGLSYNRRSLGLVSEIFVIEGSLASVMLTIGHEIGHVLTATLEDKALEEAKAYAFSFSWMEIIRENDILGLGESFVSTLPAANGIHDKGYNFVKKLIFSGKNAFEIYRELVTKEIVAV